MATVKQILVDAFAQVAFKKATVEAVRELSPHFRLIDLAGDDLRSMSCKAGDKIQVVVDGGDLRTYSPFSFDARAGRVRLLVFAHGDAPGCRWVRGVEAGASVRFFGPRGSIALSSMTGPVVLFGDETSLGVARSLIEHRGDAKDVGLVLEVGSIAESTIAANAIEISPVFVELRADHLTEVEQRLHEALRRHAGATLVLTGKAQSIQSVRALLKRSPHARTQKVRAYWSVGKTGLD